MPDSAVAGVVADVQQTPIFVVAAVANINLRRHLILNLTKRLLALL